MGTGKKILIGTGIVATIGGIAWTINYLMGKKKVGDKLDTITTAMVHSVKLNGLTLRIDVILKNPTEGTLTIKQPYVKVLFENKVIGTSQLQDKVIEIAKYGAKPIDPIYLTIPATGLLTLGDGLFKVLLKKQPAKITTITTTSIKIGNSFVNYEKPDVITLKPKA
ncbi:MAG: hypothetical protein JNL60_14690 [Bacteroidia bacterium]|nr:hypothetical protein [Bacteroidia bacterium]